MTTATANSTKAQDSKKRNDSAYTHRPFTVTKGRAFINALTRVMREEREPLYFAKVGLLTGREAVSENKYRDRVQFVDLLVGGAIKMFVEQQFSPFPDSDQEPRITLDKNYEGYVFDGVLCAVEIHDLHFTADVSDRNPEKAYINNNGVLASIALTASEGV